jgi:hypothetical protein
MQYSASAQPFALPTAADLEPDLTGAQAIRAISALFREHSHGRLAYYREPASGQWWVTIPRGMGAGASALSLKAWAAMNVALTRHEVERQST